MAIMKTKAMAKVIQRLQKVNANAAKIGGKVMAAAAGVMVSARAAYYGLTLQMAGAAKFKSGSEWSSSGSDDIGLNPIIDYIIKGVEGVGVIFMLIGGISIATAIKSGEQNPEAITGAIKNILVGGLLLGLGFIVGGLTK